MLIDRALSLLAAPSRFSHSASQLLDEKEKRLGIRFPIAVREWYSLENAAQVLGDHSNDDHPVEFDKLGEPVPHSLEFLHGSLGRNRLLLVMTENQAVCHWAVRMDAGDDPEVWVGFRTNSGFEWKPHAESFSLFLYAQFWGHPCAWPGMIACDTETRWKDIEYLRKHLSEGPRTVNWPGDNQYRFDAPQGRILLWESEGQVDWTVMAPDENKLDTLAKSIIHLGGLRTSLERY